MRYGPPKKFEICRTQLCCSYLWAFVGLSARNPYIVTCTGRLWNNAGMSEQYNMRYAIGHSALWPLGILIDHFVDPHCFCFHRKQFNLIIFKNYIFKMISFNIYLYKTIYLFHIFLSLPFFKEFLSLSFWGELFKWVIIPLKAHIYEYL